eukprot:CAMPEP_0184013504 /NCGR_PEP_ID=MMETSP0954-20121128/5057_1 /TAXON_ID=627963 /ORGANISM="Aplanochytrium sp, Strain PBS07" /LENGTH=233 /DNA_ID=CAMNT_0026293715 /DNA_START=165 /DNA_END=866 /DNA_ORIENTATION=-
MVEVSLSDLEIREERPEDYENISNVVRNAFWNLYIPGAEEHVVLTKLRTHPDFLQDLTLVCVYKGEIIGHIAYTKSYVGDTVLATFGPVCISEEYHGKGIGTHFIKESIARVKAEKFKAIAILGFPTLYERFGFRNSKEYEISGEDGSYPKGQQILELYPGALNGIKGEIKFCSAFHVLPEEVESFESKLPFKKKFPTLSQKMFGIVVSLSADDEYPEIFNEKACFDRTPLNE